MFSWFLNYWEEVMQKTSWRLVRAAEDRFGAEKGSEKRAWAVDRMQEEFPKVKRTVLEDHVRAAYMNFRVEHSVFERRI
jgi:hypothetical protein